jgi:2',3'-cyclic-nucleotide 2'-phosphodiesterase (5'-nucleotidase family)
MSKYRLLSVRYILLLVSFMMISCSASRNGVEHEPYYLSGFEYWNYSMADFIDDDEVIASIIVPYRTDIEGQLSTVLTRSTGIIERGKPEGALGNLTADILRNRATREIDKTVHIAILNNGGLRVPLPEGPVNIGHIFELMPFENHITILKLTGEQVISLADEIAAVGGEPVSGIRFRIKNGRAEDVLVGSRSVDPNERYWIATNNWLADGGGDMPTLWSPQERWDMQVLIRDAFIEYLKYMPVIEPVTDSRIR